MFIFVKVEPVAEISDLTWMRRCFDLASRGIGQVSPNPPVGAVLVWNDRILGEGYHTRFGGPHAEVEAVRSVPGDQTYLIPDATLYVSLEPCCVFGKTPPCTNLILEKGIKDVRISTLDPNPEVAGKGIAILRQAGVSVRSGILESEGRDLIRTFQTNILKNRPHIVLKWAQSKWGIMGIQDRQVWLSHPDTGPWTHSLRAGADAILVGARTVVTDNPALTTRLFPGHSPHRVILDPNGRLHGGYRVFEDDGRKVFYFSKSENPRISGEHIIREIYPSSEDAMNTVLHSLFRQRIGSLLVEGGAHIHKMFIDEGCWDEAWVIRTRHPLDQGLRAPVVRGRLIRTWTSGTDVITGIENVNG